MLHAHASASDKCTFYDIARAPLIPRTGGPYLSLPLRAALISECAQPHLRSNEIQVIGMHVAVGVGPTIQESDPTQVEWHHRQQARTHPTPRRTPQSPERPGQGAMSSHGATRPPSKCTCHDQDQRAAQGLSSHRPTVKKGRGHACTHGRWSAARH